LARLGSSILLFLAPLRATADDGSVEEPQRAADPRTVTGVERAERERGDAARDAANVLLFLPRATVELLFTATGAAAVVVEEEQVVPRVEDMLHPPAGEIRAFPTLFVETGNGFNVGARAIARAHNYAASVRGGIGGAHDFVAESRVGLSLPKPLPFALSMETFQDERSSIGYLGLGQDPESDIRNRFAATAPALAASYRERRGRYIVSAGTRVLPDLELLVSTSLTRRHVLDPLDADNTLARVFVPGSVAGAGAITHFVYDEAAVRLDTRATRGGPATGVLLEGYAGRSDGIKDTHASFARLGGRAGAFLSIVERDNVLSPRLSLDGLTPLDGEVPFNELTGQPDFRGFDNRRDYVSTVASVDYRWTVMRYLAARLFVDAATVAPSVADLKLDGARFAGGFGLDVFSRSTQLGSIAFVGSGDGLRFTFSFGVSSGFGDRQHRG
jgi:hypothetical protein